MSDGGEATEVATFRTGDLVVMIAHLTNAVTLLNTAMTQLVRDDKAAAIVTSEQVGEKVDLIVDMMRYALGEDVTHGG